MAYANMRPSERRTSSFRVMRNLRKTTLSNNLLGNFIKLQIHGTPTGKGQRVFVTNTKYIPHRMIMTNTRIGLRRI